MGNDIQLYESQQLKTMIEVANAMPRDLTNFVDNVYSEVMKDATTNQEFALSCIYCVPVGKDVNGVQKFHSDPSVRITEIMQKYWKHLRVIVTGTVDSEEISVNGLIVDCQANNAETLVDRVGCKEWSERRKALKLKAMQSIMKRDLRLSIMGKGYANQLKNKIFEGIFPDIQKGWKMCIGAFNNIGVKEKVLLNYFKISSPAEITRENLFNALGIYNYLKETGEDPEKVFAVKTSKPNVSTSDIKITDNKKPRGKTKRGRPPQKPIETPASPDQDNTSSAMDQDEFSGLISMLALKAGVSVEEGLKEIVGVDHPDDVLADDQSKVIDFFTDKAETPAA